MSWTLVRRTVVGLLVAGTLPITLARLTAWTGDLGIVLMAFAPFALGSYAVALVVLLGSLARGARSRPELVATAATGILLLLHVWWCAPLVVGGAPDPAADAERVTVLSVNVKVGAGDAASVVDTVRDEGVDILVVSEITARFVAAADGTGLGTLLPYRVGESGDTTQGTMVFSSAPIEEIARVSTIFDSLVVRTHDLTLLGAHPAPPQLPEEWRHDQPLLLEAALTHRVDAVVGDLNATLDHPGIRDLVDAGWRDAVELTNGGFAPTWPADGERGFPLPVVQIDHVLVRDSYAVTRVRSLEVPGTDHLAVLATLAATG